MHTISQGLKATVLALLFGLPELLNATAASVSNPESKKRCVRLGSNPSFIVKFKHQAPLATVNNQYLKNMSVAGIKFVGARPMSNNNYIVFFKEMKGLNSVLSEVSSGCYSQETVDQLLHAIKQQKHIEDASSNAIHFLDSRTKKVFEKPIVSDSQWALLAPPGGIDAENAWYDSQTTGKPQVVIAVLDSGVYPNRSLLPNQLPGVHFTDNGSYGNDASPSCAWSEDCFGNPAHGTHVSGIAAASAQYAYGQYIYGIAPTSKFVPVNVFTKFIFDVNCLPESTAPCIAWQDADLINALNWVSGVFQPAGLRKPPAGIVAINMSLGSFGSCSSIIQQPIDTARQKGISSVVSAMNENLDAATMYPANCKKVISVAATGPSGEKAAYSSWGSTVKIAAPGGNFRNPYYPDGEILSTYVEDAPYYGYSYAEGTSMAAPLVAGVIALLYSVDPKMTPEKVLSILTNKQAVTPFPTPSEVPPGTQSCVDPKHPRETCGVGILNARKVLALAAKK